jgi:enoyl-[acyl-carrier protein] reductase I
MGPALSTWTTHKITGAKESIASLASKFGTTPEVIRQANNIPPQMRLKAGSTILVPNIAHDISAYSFPAMAKAALPLLKEGSSLLTLSYLGAVRAIPYYNTMGLAKASLEASVRYLAENLGKLGIRANGISAGPIKTLAASGIKDFGKLLGFASSHAPLRRNVTIEEVGNTAAFMLSDLASGITGEITYVDGGFSHVMGLNAEDYT